MVQTCLGASEPLSAELAETWPAYRCTDETRSFERELLMHIVLTVMVKVKNNLLPSALRKGRESLTMCD